VQEDWHHFHLTVSTVYLPSSPNSAHAYGVLSITKARNKMKGDSVMSTHSHWINQNHLVKGRFAWGRGYGAFSVSHSDVKKVANYIARQEEHHRKRSFAEEYAIFVERYGLEWRDD
jgi:putative transposase